MTLTKSGQNFISGPVKLHGFQSILKPSKFGYSLSALLPEDDVDLLESDRTEALKWATSKLKNPKRSVEKPTPWEPLDDAPGYVRIKLSWNDERKPTIRDAENTEIIDTSLPIHSGSVVRLAFKQRPYVLKDGETYGTSLKLSAVQIIKLNSGAGYDSGELTTEDINNLFPPTKGFSVNDPNVVIPVSTADDDF